MLSVSTCRKIFSQRTFLEKCLLAAISASVCIIVAFLLVLVLRTSKVSDLSNQRLICNSESCDAIGGAIVASLDTSVNPCEDFYNYCCGGFLRKHNIPQDLGQYGVTEMLRESVLEKHRELLSNLSDEDLSNEAVKNAEIFFSSCLDSDEIERSSVKSLMELMVEFGGWPLLGGIWNVSKYDPVDAVAKIQLRTSYGFGIQVVIVVDPKNSSKNLIQLDSPSFTLSQSVLLDQDNNRSRIEIFNYKQFFLQLLKLFNVSGEKEHLQSLFQDILTLETLMSEAVTPSDKRPIPKRMIIAELQNEVPKIQWLKFLQDITNSSLLSLGTKYILTEFDEIFVLDIPYLKSISKIFTEKSQFIRIANYLGWRIVTSHLVHLPSSFQNALLEYSKASGFNQDMPPKWKTCVHATVSSFNDALSYLYVKRYFPKETKNEVTKFVMDLRYQFESSISRLDWMDKTTKKAAESKLNAMRNNIGYPYWISDGDVVSGRFRKSGLPPMGNNIFENNLAITFRLTQKTILKLREKNVKQEWPLSPITVNAGYNRNINGITFPAAFLQEPMFSFSVPKFYNYATIGTVIGHEITHGFDNEGRLRNETGEISNWWTNKSEDAFLSKAQCFVNQYNAYGLNGKRTLAENIADNGGLRQAYMEFLRWKKTQQVTYGFPGLERFSIEQQFFLSYGSIWCTKYRPEYWNSSVLNADHSPAPYRVIGTVSNLDEFLEVFNCPKHVANNKCKIW